MSGYQVSNPVFSVAYDNGGNVQMHLLAVQQGITKQYASEVTASGNSVDAPTIFGFTEVHGTPNFNCAYTLPSAADMLGLILGFYQASVGSQGLHTANGLQVPKGLRLKFQVYNHTNTALTLSAGAGVMIQSCAQNFGPNNMMLLEAVVLNASAGSESVKVIQHACSPYWD